MANNRKRNEIRVIDPPIWLYKLVKTEAKKAKRSMSKQAELMLEESASKLS